LDLISQVWILSHKINPYIVIFVFYHKNFINYTLIHDISYTVMHKNTKKNEKLAKIVL